MFDTHQRYEELCALAATGQMPESENAGFQAHLADCPECSALLMDFAQTGACLVAGRAAGQRSQRVPDGMTERFIARARTEGIAMSPMIVERRAKPPVRMWVAVAGAVAVLVLILTLVLRVKAPVPQVSARNVTTRPGDAPQAAVPEPPPGPRRDELPALRTQVEALTARLRANRETIAASQREKEALQARVAALEQEKKGLQANDSEHVATISRLQADIDKMNREKAANEVAILAEENELRELRRTLAQKEAVLEQQQRLLAAGNQARDLVVARNLHMVDVYDTDGEGNQERAFGRIFYTEGKSLIFYAYDLSSPRNVDRQISFYAWGERLGGNQPVKKLGIFHNEDVNDGRWVLTFDDPRVLAQINSVFVTGEKDRNAVTRPTGRRMLFGFLGNKANHP